MPIEITPALLAELREKAEAYSNFGQDSYLEEDSDRYLAMTFFHAAADPAVVLALVAEIERLRAVGDDMTAAYMMGYHRGKGIASKGGGVK